MTTKVEVLIETVYDDGSGVVSLVKMYGFEFSVRYINGKFNYSHTGSRKVYPGRSRAIYNTALKKSMEYLQELVDKQSKEWHENHKIMYELA